jgi:hypothetical protein
MCAFAFLFAPDAAAAQSWTPNVARVGDPATNYSGVEITPDGKYLVWVEADPQKPGLATAWHCGIDLYSGRLMPGDCRGFRAFETNMWSRPNPGRDAQGAYYVGQDRDGRIIVVRPTSSTTASVKVLSTPPDPRRRNFYPTVVLNEPNYLLMTLNSHATGPGTWPQNSWVELQYIDLAKPDTIHTIERQDTPLSGEPAAMDIGFARWIYSNRIVTYGFPHAGKIELRSFDAGTPGAAPQNEIVDGVDKIDGFGMRVPVNGTTGAWTYLFAGIDRSTFSRVYRKRTGPFQKWRSWRPKGTTLLDPALAQSHEPFVRDGRLYTAHQINERGRSLPQTAFRNPGEIWLADVTEVPVTQWKIAPAAYGPASEPEIANGPTCTWVFYSQFLGTLAQGIPFVGLYRASTPWCPVN